jgi:mannosyltransferase
VSRRLSWIALALLFGAFALRIYRLDSLSLRGDESFTVLFSARPLAELVEGIRNVEPNPPLYYLVLRGAMLLFGHSDFSTRYVSAFFGVLAIPLLYQLGRTLVRDRRLGGRVALVAAGLLAVNPYQIWHSQDVRNYTLWPALSLASLYFFMRVLRKNRWPLWVAYAVTALLSLYTHYYDVFIILLENLFVFMVYWRNRAILKRWILVQAAVAALYLPWPLLFSSRALTYVDATAQVPGLLGIIQQSLATFGLGETLPQSLVTLFLPLLGILLVLGLGFAFFQDRHAFLFLVLYLFIPSFCIFLLTLWRPLFRVRYLNVIAPGYYLAFALALVALARLRRGVVLSGAIGLAALVLPAGLSLGHYYFDPAYAKSADWRGLAAYLETQAGPGDVIVENYPDPTLAYYYTGPSERLVLPNRSAVDQVGDLPVNRMATGKALQQLLAEHQRLWLIPYRSGWDPQGYVEGWLDRRAHKVREDQVDVFRLVVYERAETTEPLIGYPMMSRLGDKIQFLGYDLDTGGGCRIQEVENSGPELVITEPASCVVGLTLYWQDLALMDVDYTVFTHLQDPSSQIQAQHDSQPQAEGFPTTQWFPQDVIADKHDLVLSPGAPPGQYVLQVGMYRLESGQRLPAYDAEGQRWPDDAIQLDLSIQVGP